MTQQRSEPGGGDDREGGGAQAGDGSPAQAAGRRVVVLTMLRTVLVVAGLVVAYYELPMDKPFGGGYAVALVLGLAAITALLVWQVRAIARSPHPRLRAVDALASSVPPFLLLYAAAYYLMERGEAGSFAQPITRTDALYFAVTVFSTVGFGDIAPHSQAARIVVVTQMIGDLLLIGLAARVVVGAVQEGVRRNLT
ncbi:MAG TPA: potassium channel family protein [Actinospica sp.]|nr:potassium channel family protein [Actinospica sp.]